MKINKELITKLQSYGFNLSPAVYGGQYDKAPGRKSREKWRYDWSEEELSKSKRIGVFHDPSSTYDIDFDDKSFVAHQFHSLLPDTFSIGKQWKGSATLTHKVYALPNPFSEGSLLTMFVSDIPTNITITVYSLLGTKVI